VTLVLGGVIAAGVAVAVDAIGTGTTPIGVCVEGDVDGRPDERLERLLSPPLVAGEATTDILARSLAWNCGGG
jgi:hypothetical protein